MVIIKVRRVGLVVITDIKKYYNERGNKRSETRYYIRVDEYLKYIFFIFYFKGETHNDVAVPHTVGNGVYNIMSSNACAYDIV